MCGRVCARIRVYMSVSIRCMRVYEHGRLYECVCGCVCVHACGLCA